jgi:serine/threonine-protein kinase
VGTKLKGRYSVGKVLGQGGFGITYMGGDITLSRPIAIKELFPEGCIRNQTTVQPTRPDIQNEFAHIKQRFIEEARLLARLNHPGIVKVYDFFEENNTAYMIMELLKGKSCVS